jgi:hypothetical protein
MLFEYFLVMPQVRHDRLVTRADQHDVHDDRIECGDLAPLSQGGTWPAANANKTP